MASKTNKKNNKFLWLGGVVVVVLGLLMVGMYGNNLKTMAGFPPLSPLSLLPTPRPIEGLPWGRTCAYAFEKVMARDYHTYLSAQREILRRELIRVRAELEDINSRIDQLYQAEQRGENVQPEMGNAARRKWELLDRKFFIPQEIEFLEVRMRGAAELLNAPTCPPPLPPDPPLFASTSPQPTTSPLSTPAT